MTFGFFLFLVYGTALVVALVFFAERAWNPTKRRRPIPSELLLFLAATALAVSTVLGTGSRYAHTWFLPQTNLHSMKSTFYKGDSLRLGLVEACYAIDSSVALLPTECHPTCWPHSSYSRFTHEEVLPPRAFCSRLDGARILVSAGGLVAVVALLGLALLCDSRYRHLVSLSARSHGGYRAWIATGLGFPALAARFAGSAAAPSPAAPPVSASASAHKTAPGFDSDSDDDVDAEGGADAGARHALAPSRGGRGGAPVSAANTAFAVTVRDLSVTGWVEWGSYTAAAIGLLGAGAASRWLTLGLNAPAAAAGAGAAVGAGAGAGARLQFIVGGALWASIAAALTAALAGVILRARAAQLAHSGGADAAGAAVATAAAGSGGAKHGYGDEDEEHGEDVGAVHISESADGYGYNAAATAAAGPASGSRQSQWGRPDLELTE